MPLNDDSFFAWYSLYPRKVARKAAEKAWARVATSPEVIEQIMAGLKAQLPKFNKYMEKNDSGFIPHPATWLNGERWKDEITPKQQPRVIACEKCGDTGVLMVGSFVNYSFEPCSCPIGQLPGALAGVEE